METAMQELFNRFLECKDHREFYVHFMNERNNYIMKEKNQNEVSKGLYNKYFIAKINNGLLESVNDNAEYFVLRLDMNGKDKDHVNACRKAILKYADEIKNHLPELSKNLIDKYSN